MMLEYHKNSKKVPPQNLLHSYLKKVQQDLINTLKDFQIYKVQKQINY